MSYSAVAKGYLANDGQIMVWTRSPNLRSSLDQHVTDQCVPSATILVCRKSYDCRKNNDCRKSL